MDHALPKFQIGRTFFVRVLPALLAARFTGGLRGDDHSSTHLNLGRLDSLGYRTMCS